MRHDIHKVPSKAGTFWRYFSDMRTRAAAEPGGSEQPGRAKILVVEDNMLLSMQIEEALVDAGFDVVGKAASAEQAIACARQERPDLMVVDVRLEGDRDGIDAAADIYAELGIRAIFASSFSAQDLKARTAAARPLAWISKPYDMESLVGLVRDALPDKKQN